MHIEPLLGLLLHINIAAQTILIITTIAETPITMFITFRTGYPTRRKYILFYTVFGRGGMRGLHSLLLPPS